MSDKELTEDDLKNMSAEEIAELQKQNCIFCKIAEKQVPSKIVHEDADNLCILDINPASEGHILVYPKKHYMILPHIPDDALFKLFQDVKLMSHTLLKTLQCRGTTVFIANGAAAGQRAPHVLIHVFPRRENDDLVKLPKYEMSDDQIERLKKDLKPYVNHMFGNGKPRVREAQFTEKMETHEAKDEHEPERGHIELHPIRHDGPHHEPVKSAVEKKKSPVKKESGEPKSLKKDSNVDLDDIARLFGG